MSVFVLNLFYLHAIFAFWTYHDSLKLGFPFLDYNWCLFNQPPFLSPFISLLYTVTRVIFQKCHLIPLLLLPWLFREISIAIRKKPKHVTRYPILSDEACGSLKPGVSSLQPAAQNSLLPNFLWPRGEEWLENIFEIILHGRWKWYEIQISVAVNKVCWNTACSFGYLLSMTAFTLQWQSWIVVTDLCVLRSPKYLLPIVLQTFAEPWPRFVVTSTSVSHVVPPSFTHSALSHLWIFAQPVLLSATFTWLTPASLSDPSSNFISSRKLFQNPARWMRSFFSVILLMSVSLHLSLPNSDSIVSHYP